MKYRKKTKEEIVEARTKWHKVFIVFPRSCYKDHVSFPPYESAPHRGKLDGLYDTHACLEVVERRQYNPSYPRDEWASQYRTLQEANLAYLRDENTKQEIGRHKKTFGK